MKTNKVTFKKVSVVWDRYSWEYRVGKTTLNPFDEVMVKWPSGKVTQHILMDRIEFKDDPKDLSGGTGATVPALTLIHEGAAVVVRDLTSVKIAIL